MFARSAEWRVAWAERRAGDRADRPAALRTPAMVRLLTGTAAMAQAELRKLRHDNIDIATRAAQPLLWLFIFGTAMQSNRSLTERGIDYRAYLAPGVMAQAALFIAIFFGLAVIWERDVGQLQRLLATPIPRTAIVLGKAVGAGVRAVAQAVVLLAVIALARIDMHWNVLGIVGALLLLVLGTGAFACLSMLLAAVVRTRDRFMGIGQLITMPLFFASSALYPLSIMPGWLQALSRVNPLTYEVQGLRELLLGIGSGELWLDVLVLVAFFVVLAAAATRLYPRAVL